MPNGVAGAEDRAAEQFFLAVVQFMAQVAAGQVVLGLAWFAEAAAEQASPTLVAEVVPLETRALRGLKT